MGSLLNCMARKRQQVSCLCVTCILNGLRMNRHVALKVVKSAPRYTETALDEIKLLQRLIDPYVHRDPAYPANPIVVNTAGTHPGRSHVISFLDHFKHKGPNGTHVCMVFEVLGENLLSLIKRHQSRGVPVGIVRQIAKQVPQFSLPDSLLIFYRSSWALIICTAYVVSSIPTSNLKTSSLASTM